MPDAQSSMGIHLLISNAVERGSMWNPVYSILLVIILAGLFGGVINYYLSPPEENTRANLLRSLTLGTGAAFLVPLFLNMISSNLLEVIRGTASTPADTSKLFVFAGFCLVAAISSKAFIRTLSDRILHEAQEARRDAEAAKEEVAEVQAVLKPIVAKETESDTVDPSVASQERFTQGTIEERVLHALLPGRWTLRSLSGIAKEAGLDKIETARVLSDLSVRGLIARRTGENGPRWFITEEGRKAISSS